MDIPLIKTKLHRPPVAKDHLHRERLIELLDENLERPLTIVSAPAGYGKTTLVSCWIETCAVTSVWLSLDENDNDLRVFLTYLTSAIQTIFPEALEQTCNMLTYPDLPAASTLLPSLINELDQIDKNFILVLDDFHYISDITVNQLIIGLLKYPPAPMHLVLSTRRDPSISLLQLRARNKVAEIRLRELRMSKTETDQLLENLLGRSIDTAASDLLYEKTEGWVTGLLLAALSLQRHSDYKNILKQIPAENQYVTDYLLNEVLVYQPQEIHEYLLATSVLKRFCAPLCDEMCAIEDGSWVCKCGGTKFIDWLKQSDLFVVPLDGRGRWFRYHHVFRKLLKNRLERKYGQAFIDTLCIRASAWFEKNGYLEEAIEYALNGGDVEAATRIVAVYRHELMNRERWHRLERIMHLLPDRVLQDNTEMILQDAWLKWYRMQIADMIKRLNRVEPQLAASEDESTSLRPLMGEYSLMRGLQYYLEAPFDASKVLYHAKNAIQCVPHNRISQRGMAFILLGHAYQAAGDLDNAKASVYEAINENRYPDTTYHGRLLMTIGFIHWIEADLPAMQEVAQKMLDMGYRHDLPEILSIARYFQGIYHYCRNELAPAEENLAAVIKDRHKVNIYNFSHSAVVLALTLQARGRSSEADMIVEKFIRYALDTDNIMVLKMGHAFQAELALRQGNLASAGHWSNAYDPDPMRATNRFFMAQLVLVKVLLAQNTSKSIDRAADLLPRLQDFFTSIHNRRFQLEVMLLKALLHDVRDEEEAALLALENAVTLAEPGGFIRPFLDLDSHMADLLNRLARKKNTPAYLGRLLAEFKEERLVYPEKFQEYPPAARKKTHSRFINEALTNREVDIVTLLSRRLSNKEIAEKLFISHHTVKKHTMNIYGKLNVNSRRRAADKAKSLGII
jgi:LuxR family maltose regulon positive regulatory protein